MDLFITEQLFKSLLRLVLRGSALLPWSRTFGFLKREEGTEVGPVLILYRLIYRLSALPVGAGTVESTIQTDSQILTTGWTNGRAKNLHLLVQLVTAGITLSHAHIILGNAVPFNNIRSSCIATADACTASRAQAYCATSRGSELP